MPQGYPSGGGPGDGGDSQGGPSGGAPATFDAQALIDILSGGSPSSSSSGSSSSGPAPPIDPNITQGIRDYYSIWGTMAPTGYIENLVLKQGMNHYEIVANELMKPRAQTTVFYRDKFAYYAQAAARIFGRR